MTADAVRAIAQSDPVPHLTAEWGRLAAEARRRVSDLAAVLRRLDDVQSNLQERGLTVSTDLGPIGNAAAAARRDLERDRPGTPFTMPKAG